MSLLYPCHNCRGFHEYCAVPSACDCDECLKMEMEYCDDMIYLARTNDLNFDDLNFDNGGETKTTIEKVTMSSGEYLNGEFVKTNAVTEVVITTKPELVTKQYPKENGEVETKEQVECMVRCNDAKKSDVKWTMNNTTRNSIVDVLGTDESAWLAKPIPITVNSNKGGKAAIYTDEVRFGKLYTKGTLD